MSSQPTEETLRGLDQAEYLGTATRTQMPTVSPKLAEVYGSLTPVGAGEGSVPIDWDLFQGSNADILKGSCHNVRQSANTYRANKVKAKGLRRRRDGEAKDLRQRHRSLGAMVAAAYENEGALELVGLDIPPERRHLSLREQWTDIIARLRGPELPERVGSTRPGHAPLDFESLADEHEAAFQLFDKTLDELTEMKKVIDESLVAKRKAQKDHRRVYVNVGRIQEGLYRLAGLDDLADRLRVTLRKRRTVAPAEDGAPSDPPATDDSPAAPAQETALILKP